MTTGEPVSQVGSTTTSSEPDYASAEDNGPNYLSGDYQRINTLLRALAVTHPRHLDAGWSLPTEDAELTALAAAWRAQAIAVGTRIDEGSWGSEEVVRTWIKIVSIRQRWDREYPTRSDALVWRGDSHYFLDSAAFAELAAAAALQGTGAALTIPSFLSTTYTDEPEGHNYIGKKSVVWRIELAVGHGGRVLGGNNPSEGELTFDAGTTLHVDGITRLDAPGLGIDVGGGRTVTFPHATTLIRARIGPDARHPRTAKVFSSRPVASGQGIPVPPPLPTGKATVRPTEEQRNDDRVAAIVQQHRTAFGPPRVKRAFFLVGGPGSGKSKVWEDRYRTPFPEALVIDPDTFKPPGGNHNLQHADSKTTAKALLVAARRAGLSFVYDSTGSDHSLYLDAMRECRREGWSTTAVVVVAPADVAIERVRARPGTDATRQVIDAQQVQSMNDAVRTSLQRILGHEEIREFLTEVELWDNGADGPAERAWAWVAAARDPIADPTEGIAVFDRLRAGTSAVS